MTQRKRTRSQEQAHIDLMLQLQENERWLKDFELRRRQIPGDWHRMDKIAPVEPKKARVTTLLDADVLRWFRALGRGYQARMNAVLRAYVLAVMAKEIETRRDRDWKGDPI